MSAVKDKNIPLTYEIIKDVSEKNNIDEKLLKKQYYFFAKKLLETVEDENVVAIRIDGFGTFYLPLLGAARRENLARDLADRGFGVEKNNKWASIYEKKRHKIEELIKRAEELGINKKPYLKKFSHVYKILNE